MYIRSVINSPQCLYCRSEDTLEHFCYQCPITKLVWDRIFRTLRISTQNAVEQVIFGMLNERNAINLIILLVKQYIVGCKLSYNQVEPKYEGARALIQYHVQTEKHTATANNTRETFANKWHDMIDENDAVKM